MSQVYSRRSRTLGERRDYRLILTLTFPAFLAVALVRRVFVGATAEARPRSLIAEARALADSTLPFAFMG